MAITQAQYAWGESYAKWIELNQQFNDGIAKMHSENAKYPLALSEEEYQAGEAAKFAWKEVEIEMQVGRLLRCMDSFIA